MRAGARLDAPDALRGERSLPEQKFSVFLRVNVVGDDGEIATRPKALAEAIDKRRLTRAHRPGDPDPKCARSVLIRHLATPAKNHFLCECDACPSAALGAPWRTMVIKADAERGRVRSRR